MDSQNLTSEDHELAPADTAFAWLQGDPHRLPPSDAAIVVGFAFGRAAAREAALSGRALEEAIRGARGTAGGVPAIRAAGLAEDSADAAEHACRQELARMPAGGSA